MKKIIFVFMIVGIFLLVACGDNTQDNTKQEETKKVVDVIEFVGEKSIRVIVGGEVELPVELQKNAESISIIENAIISIENDSIASYSNNTIKGLSTGKTNITITYKDDKTKKFDIELEVYEEVKEEPITVTFPEIPEEIEVGDFTEFTINYECDGLVTITVSSNDDGSAVISNTGNTYRISGECKCAAIITIKLESKTDKKEKEYTVFITSHKSLINYVLDNGSLGENSPAKYEEGATTYLVDPVKEGYTFVGWCIGNISANYVDSVGPEYTGDVTVYAVWKKN